MTDTGFRLSGGAWPNLDVTWEDITEIVAYKFDAFGYDVICFGFRLGGGDNYIKVTEECPGFEQFRQAVEARFPLKENWWHDVEFPAFETNLSTVWERRCSAF